MSGLPSADPPPPASARALLPRLGPWPRGLRLLAPLLLLSAWLLLLPASLNPWGLLPGDPSAEGISDEYVVHGILQEEGLLRAAASRQTGWPVRVDRLLLHGHLLDAFLEKPLIAVLGFPAGHGLFLLLSLWGAGLGAAWLGGRWWRSREAALISGISYQSSAALTLALAGGAHGMVLVAALLPLFLGQLLLAWGEARVGASVLAALTFTVAALVERAALPVLAVAGSALLLLALVEGVPTLKANLRMLAVSLAILGLPVIYVLMGRRALPGLDLGPEDLVGSWNGVEPLVNAVARRALHVGDLVGGRAGAGPLLLLLGGFASWRERPRRWLGPTLLIAAGLGLVQGPSTGSAGAATLPMPFDLILATPFLSLWRDPSSAFPLVALGLSLLGAGGAARLPGSLPRWRRPLAVLLPALLLAEAFLVLPQLPLPTMDARASAAGALLAEADGPYLRLPYPLGALGQGVEPLGDLRATRRPTVHGARWPLASEAPAAVRFVHSRSRSLRHLLACEADPSALPEFEADAGREDLRSLGLESVYVDTLPLASTEDQGQAYLACVERLLGPPSSERGVLRVHDLH